MNAPPEALVARALAALPAPPPAPLARRIAASPRLGARALALAASRLGRPQLAGTDAAILAAMAEPARLAGLAGAVLHARAVLSIIEGGRIAALAADLAGELGGDVRDAALAGAGLDAGMPAPAVLAPPLLAQAIRDDGRLAVLAWIETLPAAAAAAAWQQGTPWPGAMPAEAHRRAGPAALRCLAEAGLLP